MSYILEPASFYVGDKVKLFFPLPKNHKYEATSFKIKQIEQNECLFINDISITAINNTDYLLITFTPWQAGNVEFPSLENIGLNVSLPNISVPSVLDQGGALTQTLQESRPPILLDGTVYLLYKYVISSVVICLFLIFVITVLKKKGMAFLNLIIKQRAILLFYIKLNSLKIKLKKREKFEKNNECLKLKSEWIKCYENYLRLFIFSIYKIKNKQLFESLTYKEIRDFIKASKDNYSIDKDINLVFKKLYILRFSDFANSNLLQEKELIEASFKLLSTYRKEK